VNSIDKVFISSVSGILVSGKKMVTPPMKVSDIINAWNSAYPAGAKLTPLGAAFVTGVEGYGTPDEFGNDWNNLRTPNMVFHTILGSHAYRYGLSYLPADMNLMKKLMLLGQNPVSFGAFSKALEAAASTDTEAAIKAVSFLLTGLQKVRLALSSSPSHMLKSFLTTISMSRHLAQSTTTTMPTSHTISTRPPHTSMLQRGTWPRTSLAGKISRLSSRSGMKIIWLGQA
jgi:hypothetical protein